MTQVSPAAPAIADAAAAARARDQIEQRALTLYEAALTLAAAEAAGTATRTMRNTVTAAAEALAEFLETTTRASLLALATGIYVDAQVLGIGSSRRAVRRRLQKALDERDARPPTTPSGKPDLKFTDKLIADAMDFANSHVGSKAKAASPDTLADDAAGAGDAAGESRSLATRLAAEAQLEMAPVIEEALGVKLQKVWVTRGDARVREAHRKLHGTTRQVGKPFHRWLGTDQELRYPGDPKAPTDATANCRCALWWAGSVNAKAAEKALTPPDIEQSFPVAASAVPSALYRSNQPVEIPGLGLFVLTAAPTGRFNPDLHPRGKDGKFIEVFGLVDIFNLHGFQHGQRGEPQVRGRVMEITPDPDRPGDPVITVEIEDPRWDAAKFGPSVDVRRKDIVQAGAAKAKAKIPTSKTKLAEPVPPPSSFDTGEVPTRTPLVAATPDPTGPNFAPLELPPDWDVLTPEQRVQLVQTLMTDDFTTWRAQQDPPLEPVSFDFTGFDSGAALNVANTYRELANWDPATALRVDGLQASWNGSHGLKPQAIAVAHPGTDHPGGIGPKVKPSSIVFGGKYYRPGSQSKFWDKQKKQSAMAKHPYTTSSMMGDGTVTAAHEFAHQRQFRFLHTAMSEVGQAWSPTVMPDGFGTIPDSSNWPETQALRYQIPELTQTQYGHSKSSEGFAEAWAERLIGVSSPELNDVLDEWDSYMGLADALPADRHAHPVPFAELSPDEQDAFWQQAGPQLDLPGMREHYPESAATYDEWLATHQPSPRAELVDVDALIAENPQEPGEDFFQWQSRLVESLDPVTKSEVLFQIRERPEPVADVMAGAQRWQQEHGLPPIPDGLNEVRADLDEADEVARIFENAPDQADDPAVRAAYEDFKRQSEEMFEFMTRPVEQGGMGITVDFTDEVDPYPTAEAQAADLRDNHHITLQSGLGGQHEETMTRDEYDRFRAVHDVFGHAAIGGGFDRHGEWQAWLMHSMMYTPPGRDAMSTEYHGVNSAMWAGDPGSPGTGKSILLPPEYSVPPWDRSTVETAPIPTPTPVAAAGPPDERVQAVAREIIEKLGLDSDFAREFSALPWHEVLS